MKLLGKSDGLMYKCTPQARMMQCLFGVNSNVGLKNSHKMLMRYAIRKYNNRWIML